jgi:hypothetical protein
VQESPDDTHPSLGRTPGTRYRTISAITKRKEYIPLPLCLSTSVVQEQGQILFPTNQLRYDHRTNLVDEGGLCAAKVAACRAFDKLTPSISNGICPVDTRAIQPVGFPFPLPILTSVGFPVIGRSARTLTHILPFLRNCPLIARWNCPIVARRAASMARYERRPALQLLVPYLPKPSCVPSGSRPLLHLPLRYLLNFVRFGYSTSLLILTI